MITTHVLDTSLGRPAAGIPVVLEKNNGRDEWSVIGRAETDADGRVKDLAAGAPLVGSLYRLVFNTRPYFERDGGRAFYPQVTIVFETAAGESHFHVPLLLSPFGYTTYRGS